MISKLSKLKFISIACFSVLLVILISNTRPAEATVCDGLPLSDGWVQLNRVSAAAPSAPDVSNAALGTFEQLLSGAVIGGLTWFYFDQDETDCRGGENCGAAEGAQSYGWWTQKDGRTTWINFFNGLSPSDQETELGAGVNASVHVIFLGEDCGEILNFCDSFTPLDAHIYDLRDIVTNAGQNILLDVNLQGREGIWLITPVVNCGPDNRAIDLQDFQHPVVNIADPNGFEYGLNSFVRDVGFDDSICTDSVSGGEAGILDGTSCFYESQLGDTRSNHFNVLPGSTAARADTVLINFQDSYNFGTPALGYQALAAISSYTPFFFDLVENFESCPTFSVCFANIGIDDDIPDATVPLPTPTPTPTPIGTPTPTPTPTGPTPTPTGGGGGGGGGSCNTLVGPVQVGSAMANVLIPLIPVAFAFGVSALRRRKK